MSFVVLFHFVLKVAYDIFRSMPPYIAVHRGSVMVIHLPGEISMDQALLMNVTQDIMLLRTLGIKLVLVAGCRPQIRQKLQDEGIKSFFAHGNRVCDYETLKHCLSVAGHVRAQIESALSRTFASPADTGGSMVVSGNFVKAIPFGVRNGVDYKHTGIVQKLINVERIRKILDDGDFILLSHIGYSPSGEVFHCRSEDVAVTAAQQLNAAKLISACRGGVNRVHLVPRNIPGSIVNELCTRDGTGIMISRDLYEGVRSARLEDVASIVNLIKPLEAQGILVTRPTELIEAEISKFIVAVRDKEVLACCQLVQYEDERYGPGGAIEMACVAVKENMRGSNIGGALLSYCMKKIVRDMGCNDLFILMTRTQHWFLDRGFQEVSPESLPPKKRAGYDHRRKPRVYFSNS